MKVSPISWRSAKLKRTLAGETLALSQALAGTGLSVGSGNVPKPHLGREVSIRRAEQGFSGLSTRPKERRRDGADSLAKAAELAKTNTSHFTLWREQAMMKQRSGQPRLKLR